MTALAGAPARRGPRLPRWLQALVSALLLALLVGELDVGDAAARLVRANLGWVGLVLLLMVAEGVYGAYKWWVLLRLHHPSLGLGLVVRVSFVGNFTGQFLPGAAGMELMRGYGLARATGDPTSSFTSILVDRIAGLAGLMLVVLAGSLLDPEQPLVEVAPWALGGLAALALGFGLASAPAPRRLAQRLLRWLPGERARSLLAGVLERLEGFRSQRGLLARALALAVGNTLLRVSVVMAAAAALGLTAPAVAYFVVVPLVIFATLAPVSLGGFGVREAAFVTLLGRYGVPGEEGLALSLLIGVLGMVAELPGAFWLAVETPAPLQPVAPARRSARRRSRRECVASASTSSE